MKHENGNKGIQYKSVYKFGQTQTDSLSFNDNDSSSKKSVCKTNEIIERSEEQMIEQLRSNLKIKEDLIESINDKLVLKEAEIARLKTRIGLQERNLNNLKP